MSGYISCDHYDLNHDGRIDQGDVDTFRAAMGSQVGDDNWNAECDWNGDGIVTVADYNLFRHGYLHYQGQDCPPGPAQNA